MFASSGGELGGQERIRALHTDREKLSIIKTFEFDHARVTMSVVVRTQADGARGSCIVYCKGAPGRATELCAESSCLAGAESLPATTDTNKLHDLLLVQPFESAHLHVPFSKLCKTSDQYPNSPETISVTTSNQQESIWWIVNCQISRKNSFYFQPQRWFQPSRPKHRHMHVNPANGRSCHPELESFQEQKHSCNSVRFTGGSTASVSVCFHTISL